MSLKLDTEIIRQIALFENITRAHVKDCFVLRDRLTFIVQSGEMGKALGKNKANIFKIEKLLKRRIKIFEYNPNILQFVRNLFLPLRIQEIKEEENIITITGPDSKTKGLMIGANAKNLRAYEEITKRYFSQVNEIKVI
ncbi:MAG: NusA-like transcription termination signal-binding factor [Nanoarchaeota archaeon]|nr:NusA-like transcription termination signal-binding factor [Nanoarchaeota archaeon]MBU1029738.1 NusA-like transcription termination signal-binding factor [Nanoarchaeota archaeon]MBU1849163.1 NusA-like transcription termination signal-binding factor [Nanoarchaeota archaeon]